jgi:hypothetical protein
MAKHLSLSSGEIYEGSWYKGVREGEGEFKARFNGRDSLRSGIWKDDRYIGPKPSMPEIMQKYNITAATFSRTGEGNKISISFYQNGMVNLVENLTITTNNGTEQEAGKMHAFYDLRFPFYCKITYVTWNKLRTARWDCILEFRIEQPGSWDLRITN